MFRESRTSDLHGTQSLNGHFSSARSPLEEGVAFVELRWFGDVVLVELTCDPVVVSLDFFLWEKQERKNEKQESKEEQR